MLRAFHKETSDRLFETETREDSHSPYGSPYSRRRRSSSDLHCRSSHSGRCRVAGQTNNWRRHCVWTGLRSVGCENSASSDSKRGPFGGHMLTLPEERG